jgi:2-iminobutanoate/2-iminopropanoate deaminase
MKSIHTDQAPKAVGPYSQAVVSNGMVFCSGQIGIDPANQMLVEGIEAQMHQVLNNLQGVLEEAGSSLNRVIKTTIYVTDMNHLSKVNEIYGSFFTDHKPARATVAVAALPKGAIVEIDAVAEV